MAKGLPSTGVPPGSPANAIFLALVISVSALFIIAGTVYAVEEDSSEHEYHNDPFTYLLFSFLMTFATVAILTSLFTFKYGQKRSQVIAVPMLSTGIVLWALWIVFNLILKADYPDDTLFGIVHWVAAPLLKPLMALIGFALGAGLAVFIFLAVIVRS
ncbi:MAG: hypothetical protein JXA22_08690 [Candidatus Thermoplasmatota archaeon]|nr:hypothetical protein [Candidatus Thermoplasmatota archaeon]